MKRRAVWIVECAALMCLQFALLAHGISNGEKVKINGLITGRDGDTLTLRTLESGNVVVVLTDDTSVVKPKGLLKLRKEEMGVIALIPGLKIQVEGMGDAQNRVVANTIKFSEDDLKTAEATQAGLVPTQEAAQANKEDIAANKVQIASNREKIEANQQDIQDANKRFSELSDYDTKSTANVYFASGSTAISAKDKDALT